MALNNEFGAFLNVHPPRLEDAGLEDTALPAHAIQVCKLRIPPYFVWFLTQILGRHNSLELDSVSLRIPPLSFSQTRGNMASSKREEGMLRLHSLNSSPEM